MKPSTVITCSLRRDEQYLTVYRKPDGGLGQAVAAEQIPAGSDCVVRDGKAVRA